MSPFFVSEVSSNHHRDLERCFQFIDTSADIGCDAVKFQLFKIRKLFAPEILAKSAQHRQREKWELPVEFLPELKHRCDARHLIFSCTPFYLEAVEELYPYVDFYKVASYELPWDALLQACAQTGKPLVLSTGMATMDEIRHAVDVILNARPGGASEAPSTLNLPSLTLLHCVSGYPTPVEECNLAALETIRKAFSDSDGRCRVPVGWSDHTVRPEVIDRAVRAWGAEMVEFHLDLEGTGEEYGSGHCWLPDRIGSVIRELRKDDTVPRPPPLNPLPMDGDGVKAPAPSERTDRAWRADPSDGLRPMRSIREQWTVEPP